MTHVRVAVSEAGIQQVFRNFVENFTFSRSDSNDFGRIEVGYELALRLTGGSIDLSDDGTVKLKELDILWDKLEGSIGFDIPAVCVGGGCVDIPWVGPICLPRWCIFEADPDIAIDLDLAPLVGRSEISGEFAPEVRNFRHPQRPATMDYIEAQTTKDQDGETFADKWRVHLDPRFLDADPIDFADRVADLIDEALNAFVDVALGGLPGWARDLIKGIIGNISDFVRNALDIVDDFDEWLSDIFNFSFGILDLVLDFFASKFADENHILQFENPLQIMEPVAPTAEVPSGLIPVKVPIKDPEATINTNEMIVTATVGASL
jgi:hypothetical protein